MSSERISLETREDFGKIERSVRRSRCVWVAMAGGLIATGVSSIFLDREYTLSFTAFDALTTAWQFVEGRIQEASAGRINKRGDAELERPYGSLAEPLSISEARMVVRLERADRSVTNPFPPREFKRDPKN